MTTAPTIPAATSTSLEETLLKILAAVDIRSDSQCWFDGTLLPAASAPQPSAPPVPPVITALQQHLYEKCFIRPFGQPWSQRTQMMMSADGDLTPALSQANASRDRWERYWIVNRIFPDGRILVSKNDNNRISLPGEYMTHTGRGMPPLVGSAVTLLATRESSMLQPGFYFAFAETLLDAPDEFSSQLRFYWNVRDTACALLINLATTALNRFQIPFRMKCLSHRGFFDRLDAALVYVHRRFFRITADLLLEVHARLGEFVGPATPLFTRQIAPGLAIADDPASENGFVGPTANESFGTHRCRLLAESIYQSFLRRRQTPAERLNDLARYFQQQGLSLDKPHLRPGASEDYFLPEGET